MKEHAVTYVFDEVGCGKTVSAIIAMASIIDKKETTQKDGEEVKYKILVLTPKSVCAQFEAEIKDKLNIESLNVKNIAFLNNKVGVNLPTYNYVINYHIPPVPGYLEQRYGRIDRLNSKNNPLYNIYYLP